MEIPQVCQQGAFIGGQGSGSTEQDRWARGSNTLSPRSRSRVRVCDSDVSLSQQRAVMCSAIGYFCQRNCRARQSQTESDTGTVRPNLTFEDIFFYFYKLKVLSESLWVYFVSCLFTEIHI